MSDTKIYEIKILIGGSIKELVYKAKSLSCPVIKTIQKFDLTLKEFWINTKSVFIDGKELDISKLKQ